MEQGQAALRARANAVIVEALAAAGARSISPPNAVILDAIDVITSVCWDLALDLGERLALIDEALLLIMRIKELTGAAPGARSPLIVEVSRRTDALLRRYAQRVQRASLCRRYDRIIYREERNEP